MTRHPVLVAAFVLVPACTLFAPGDDDFLGPGTSGANQGGRTAAGWGGGNITPPQGGWSGETGEGGDPGGSGASPTSSGAGGEAGSGATDAGGTGNDSGAGSPAGSAGAIGGVGAGGSSTAGAGGTSGASRGGTDAGGSSGGPGNGGAGGPSGGGSGGMPSSIGCSDGTREAFVSSSAFPRIAGCKANWPRASMRTARTGRACGDAIGPCTVPADACAVGWHVCAAPPYGPAEVSAQITAEECLAAPGAYALAVGDQSCDPCSLAGDGVACCGNVCVQQHGSCVFAEQTAWFGVIDGHMNRCGDVEATYLAQGVLCCRNP